MNLSFKGRTDRKTFWLGLVSILVCIGVYFALLYIATVETDIDTNYIIWNLPFVIGGIAAIRYCVRRLHDMGMSGWYAVPTSLVVWAWLLLPGEKGSFVTESPVAWLIAFLYITLPIALIIFFSRKGTLGPNKYGGEKVDER